MRSALRLLAVLALVLGTGTCVQAQSFFNPTNVIAAGPAVLPIDCTITIGVVGAPTVIIAKGIARSSFVLENDNLTDIIYFSFTNPSPAPLTAGTFELQPNGGRYVSPVGVTMNAGIWAASAGTGPDVLSCVRFQ